MVLDCIGVGVVVMDEAGRVVLSNPEVTGMIDGAPLGAMLAEGRERNVILHPDTPSGFPWRACR